jgi:hypothetical protein
MPVLIRKWRASAYFDRVRRYANSSHLCKPPPVVTHN